MQKYLPVISFSPVVEHIECRHSPEELFACFADSPDSAFLDSSMETDVGRYSFIGIKPFLVLSGKDKDLLFSVNGRKFSVKNDPFECLDSIIQTYRINNPTCLPFVGGGIGYLSYDLKNTIERLSRNAKDDLNLPDIYFVFYQALLIRDKLIPDRVTISAVNIDSSECAKPGELIAEIKKTISAAPATARKYPSKNTHQSYPVSNFSRKNYINSVQKIIEHIRAGNIYQVCLSQRFKARWPLPPYNLYLKLNRINPSPFSAYLNCGKTRIISSSPELFLRVRGNTVETRPMKGTRPRGKNPREDRIFKDQLKKSDKDKAELSMIVDLERNDLGRIAIPGSIEVTEHRRIETYPSVFQTISVIKCRTDHNVELVDIIKAAFPGGSITGCPKIRAMEIIDELEPVTRNVYTGSIGYISFHDTMDLNIAIRTIIMKGKYVYFQTGSGIVADSDPEMEYEETLVKARALIQSVSGKL